MRRLSKDEINDVLDQFSEWLTYDNVVALDLVDRTQDAPEPTYELVVGELMEDTLRKHAEEEEPLGIAPRILQIPETVTIRGEEMEETDDTPPAIIPTRRERTQEIVEDELLGSAVLEAEEGLEEATLKVRPCPGGYFVKTEGLTGRGSLGTSISYRGEYRLLSNNHVIAKNGSVGKWVHQPITEVAGNRLKTLTGFDRIVYYANKNTSNPTHNEMDVAWCDSDTDTTSQEVRGIGRVAGRRSPRVNEEIQMFGARTNALKTARIRSVTLRYRSTGSLGYSFWKNGIALDTLVSQPGDSGSAYVASSDNQLVGLHRAGGTTSKGCPI